MNINNQQSQSINTAQASSVEFNGNDNGSNVVHGVFDDVSSVGTQEQGGAKAKKFDASDIEKSIPFPADNEQLINEFKLDLKAISEAGTSLSSSKEKFEKSYQATAILGLGKILGIYIKYFSKTTPENVKMLMEQLEEECKVGKNKKRTAFHLLSRLYRGNNTKQSSADAKVLSLAYVAEVDESGFAHWVLANDGLDKIKKSVTEHHQVKLRERPPMPTTVGQRRTLFERAADAVQKVAKAKQTKNICSVNKAVDPELFEKLRPKDTSWRVLVVNVIEGELCFHGLYDHQVDFRQNDNSGPIQGSVR